MSCGGSCPWSKQLWLDGPGLIRRFMTRAEVEDIVQVMATKEVHIRVIPDGLGGMSEGVATGDTE